MALAGNYRQIDVNAVTKKWDRWVKSIKSQDSRENMAVILENQNNYIKSQLLHEATTSTDAGTFQKIILPVIRRVYPRLVAPELVGMQPMSGPHGLAVFLRYIYDDAGTNPTPPSPNTQILEPGTGNGATGNNFYFRYSQGAMTLSTPSIGAAAASVTADFSASTVGPATTQYYSWIGAMDIIFNVSIAAGHSGTIEFKNTAPYGTTNTPGTPVWQISYGGTLISTDFAVGVSGPTDYTAASNKFVFNNTGGGNVTVTLASGPLDAVYIDATGCPIINAKGFEFGAPKQISVKFETKPIVAEDYKLGAKWSLEANQDISALHGESLEDLLANLLTQELMNETDFVVVKDLLTIAAYSQTWNKFPGIITGLPVTTSGTTGMPGFLGSLKDHWETLVFAMNDMANSIYSRILRGPANFAVCSPDVSTVLESLSEFKTASINDLDTEIGISSVGSLSSKYKVFKDARLSKGTMLMGYKGKDARDTGYVFAPYIPAVLSPVIWDPTTYAQNRMIMTRFGRATLLDGQYYYGKFAVTELNPATGNFTSI